MGIDFQRYLESICREYQHWWSLVDTLTNTIDLQKADGENVSSLFDFGLMVQKIEPRQRQNEIYGKTERLSVLEGLRKYADHESALLIGRPGAGKSTTLARLLVESAKEALQNQQSQIPVLVELRYYKDYYKTSVLDLVQAFLKRHKLRSDISTLEDLLFEGRFLLLMDGINELPDDNARTNIKLFCRDNSDTPMIFTTRDGGDDLGIRKKLEMQPLSDIEVQRFIDNCMQGQTREILQQLRDRLRELGQTPLVMWMLYFIFQKTQDVPLSSGEALRKFTQLYERKSKDDVPVSEESRRWWSGLLEHLAFEMMQADEPTNFRLSISERDAKKNFTEFLQGKDEYPERSAIICLNDLLKHHLIQRNPQNDEIEFCHQLLQEYYAAECLLQQLDQISDDELKYYYLNYLKWTEPLSLMLALPEVTEKKAVEIVRLALDVDLHLGAKLAGTVKQQYQKENVGLIIGLDVPQELKVRLLGITHSNHAITALVTALKFNDENSSVGWYAADSLGNIGSEEVVSALLPVLNYKYPVLFKNSIYALGKICIESAVLALFPFLEHENFHARSYTASALGEIGNPLAVNSLLNILENDEESSVRSKAATSLGQIGSDKAVPALVKALDDERLWVSKSAAFALAEIGSDKAVSELLNSLKKKTISLCKRATDLRNEINDEELLCYFLNRLEDEIISFRNVVTHALKKIYSDVTVPTLLKHLNNKNFSVCANAIYALGEIGNEEILPILLETLKDKNLNVCVRLESASALGKIGNEAAIPELIEALTDKISLVRAESASALGQIRSNKALSTLLEALKDNDTLVRGNCVYALGEIGSNESKAEILLALDDESPNVRISAIRALGKIGTGEVVEKLLLVLTDKDTWVCALAGEMLGKIGTEEAIQGLLPLLKDEDNSIRRGAMRGLTQTEVKIVNPELLTALQDNLQAEDQMVRHDAAYALGKIAGFQIIPNLTELLHKTGKIYLLETITAIQERCKYYNYIIATSPPLEEENNTSPLTYSINTLNQILKTMSENPKVQMNFNAPLTGSSVTGNVEGDSIGTQNNYPSAPNVAEVETVIQKLLEQIEQNKPTPIEAELIVNQAIDNHPVLREKQVIEQAMKNYPNLRIRLRRVVTAVGIETVKVIFAPAGILIEGVKAWNQPE